MAVAFNRAARERFVLPADRALPPAQQTVWILRPLTVFETMELEAKHGGKLTESNGAAYAIDLLRRALVGWENLATADGQPAPFAAVDGIATDATIEYAQPYLLDLFKAAMRLSSVTADEAGKS